MVGLCELGASGASRSRSCRGLMGLAAADCIELVSCCSFRLCWI